MEKLRKRFQRISKEKGITLVALVVTIIIIIILATVAINFAFGENGLVKMAERARDIQANSAVAEQDYMDALADELSNYIPAEVNIKESHTNENITIEVETADERVASYDYYVNGELKTSQSESTYTTSITLENKDPYMPSGFRYLEGTVDTGYVIQDTSIGNEFVWIPVKGVAYKVYVVAKNSEGREIGRTEEITVGVSELSRTVNGSGIEYTAWEEEEGDINNKKSVAYFKQSVAENSGFYMGRYEMGMPGQKSGDSPELEFTNEARNIEGTPVCVAQVMPWTNIDWSTAKANLESMYNGEVQSAMMNSYARTTTLNWILATRGKTLGELQSSGSWGNYRKEGGTEYDFGFRGNCYSLDSVVDNDGTYIISEGYNKIIEYINLESLAMKNASSLEVLIDTGADTNPAKRNIANNIFDLAGNAGEWTTEKRIDGTDYRVSGGSFRDAPIAKPAIDSNNGFYKCGTTGDIDISSRPILYK